MDHLNFVSLEEVQRIKKSIKDPFGKAAILADIFRINTLYMITKAGSGHIGSSFSSIDIVTWLWTQEMINPNETVKKHSDLYFSSKGHDVPALYSVLIGLGKIDFDMIHKLRRLGGLPGHPDVETPHIMTNTGPLGMGVSKAMGMVFARRLESKGGRIFVMCGDGESQEGAFWESLQPTTNGKFGEITVIVDHNKIQSDTWVKEVSDLGDIEAKLAAFGWEVARCDGHDFKALDKIFRIWRKVKTRPKILIADTIKGKGVSFMEKIAPDGLYKFHSGAPSIENYQSALKEIESRINQQLPKLGVQPLKLEEAEFEPRTLPENPQRLVAAYGNELVKLARKRKDIIALDADLMLDTGLIPFKNEFRDRFVECGIAEQHMVSVAGGLALTGKLPIVHSFACFLSTRPNEQIYNNATEKTKIIYVGSLAGLLPGGPGHSHQSVRDISTLGSIPNLTLIEPSNERETRMALRWAVYENPVSTYLRLVSVPITTPYDLPKDYQLKPGFGVELIRGKDAVMIAYGPVMLAEASKASRKLSHDGISLTIVNLPWLNAVDESWLVKIISGCRLVITLDDHYVKFGQGSIIAQILARTGLKLPIISLGLSKIPECGLNQEVLKYHKLDSISLAKRVKASL